MAHYGVHGYSDYQMDQVKRDRNRLAKASSGYREAWLALRKRCRELIREGKLEANEDFKRQVGYR